jgi:hypothetical protein
MTLESTQPLREISTRNLPEAKGGRCVRLTTLSPSVGDCAESVGASTSHNPMDLDGLLRGQLYLLFALPCYLFCIRPLILLNRISLSNDEFNNAYVLRWISRKREWLICCDKWESSRWENELCKCNCWSIAAPTLRRAESALFEFHLATRFQKKGKEGDVRKLKRGTWREISFFRWTVSRVNEMHVSGFC